MPITPTRPRASSSTAGSSQQQKKSASARIRRHWAGFPSEAIRWCLGGRRARHGGCRSRGDQHGAVGQSLAQDRLPAGTPARPAIRRAEAPQQAGARRYCGRASSDSFCSKTFVPRCILSSIIWRTYPRRSIARHLTKRSPFRRWIRRFREWRLGPRARHVRHGGWQGVLPSLPGCVLHGGHAVPGLSELRR